MAMIFLLEGGGGCRWLMYDERLLHVCTHVCFLFVCFHLGSKLLVTLRVLFWSLVFCEVL